MMISPKRYEYMLSRTAERDANWILLIHFASLRRMTMQDPKGHSKHRGSKQKAKKVEKIEKRQKRYLTKRKFGGNIIKLPARSGGEGSSKLPLARS